MRALRVAAVLSFVAVLGAEARQSDTLRFTLPEAVSRALEVSPEVSEVEAQRSFSEARHDFAKANRFLTEFNVTTAHALAPGVDNPNGTSDELLFLDPDVRNDWNSLRPFNQIEASILQPLYTWGELGKSIEAARTGIEVDAASVREKEAEVALRTAELFYDLQLTAALRLLTDEAGEIVQRAKREIQRLLDEGAEDVDDADLFQVMITEETFNRQVTEVTEKRATAAAAVSRQLFLPEGAIADAQGVLNRLAFSLDSLTYYQQMGLSRRPILNKADAGLSAQSALVDVERSKLYPRLILGASYRIGYTAGRPKQRNPYVGDRLNTQTAQIGIGLRQNMNLFQTRGKIRQAEARRDQVRFQQEAARQLVLFEIEQAYRNVIIRASAASAQDNALRISREWLQTETINFDLDIGDTENLVRAVQTNLSLQAERYEAIRNYNVSVVRLLHAAGILVETLESGTLVEIEEDQ